MLQNCSKQLKMLGYCEMCIPLFSVFNTCVGPSLGMERPANKHQSGSTNNASIPAIFLTTFA